MKPYLCLALLFLLTGCGASFDPLPDRCFIRTDTGEVALLNCSEVFGETADRSKANCHFTDDDGSVVGCTNIPLPNDDIEGTQ